MIDKCLKSITNAENQVALIDKFQNPVADIGFEPHGLHHAGTVIVSPAEPADKYHYLKVFQMNTAVNQGIDMHKLGLSTGQLKRVSRLVVAV